MNWEQEILEQVGLAAVAAAETGRDQIIFYLHKIQAVYFNVEKKDYVKDAVEIGYVTAEESKGADQPDFDFAEFEERWSCNGSTVSEAVGKIRAEWQRRELAQAKQMLEAKMLDAKEEFAKYIIGIRDCDWARAEEIANEIISDVFYIM